MRNDGTEAAIADLMSADQEAAMMFAAQAGAQVSQTPSLQQPTAPEPGATVSAPQSAATPAATPLAEVASTVSPAPETVPPRSAPIGPSPVDQILERRSEAVDPLPPQAPGRSSRRA
jgi:hypothetical protein